MNGDGKMVEKIRVSEVVYTSENGDKYTKEDVFADIQVWMNETDDFGGLSSNENQAIQQVTYDVLLKLLDWTAPYTKLAEFEQDDIVALVEKARELYPDLLR